MISSLRQKTAGFLDRRAARVRERVGKPDNNIATADAPSKPVRSRRREARLISRASREKRRSGLREAQLLRNPARAAIADWSAAPDCRPDEALAFEPSHVA